MSSRKTTASQDAPKTSSKRPTTKKVTKRSDDELIDKNVAIDNVMSNIVMLYQTIQEIKQRGDISKIEKINIAQEENFARLASLDANRAKLAREEYQVDNKGVKMRPGASVAKKEYVVEEDDLRAKTDELLAMFQRSQEENEILKAEAEKEAKASVNNVQIEEFEPLEDVDEVYDVLSLPSNGQCYAHKKSKIAVSYLTATDENFITSPNLYRDGLITDCLLHRKIVDKTFNIDNLCSGDADAVLFFLRVSSYGADFPATFTDPDTNQTFDTVIDLTQIKSKDFKLIGDENGFFDFELPVTKDKIKFKFLTKKEERKLEKLNSLGNNATKAVELRSIARYLDNLLEDEGTRVEEDDRYKIEDGLATINKLADVYEQTEGLPVNKLITNRLEMAVMSVNGNSDRAYIKKYVRNMIAKDSLALRRYIIENTPGLDFSITIEKPESLGGGSINTFLDWGDTVFLNIA